MEIKSYLEAHDKLTKVVKERLRLMAGAESPDMDYMRAVFSQLNLSRDLITKLEARLTSLETRRQVKWPW